MPSKQFAHSGKKVLTEKVYFDPKLQKTKLYQFYLKLR